MLESEARRIADNIIRERFQGDIHFLGACLEDNESQVRRFQRKQQKLRLSDSDLEFLITAVRSLPPARPTWSVTYLILSDVPHGSAAACVSVDDETSEVDVYVHQYDVRG
jgi:hypothetical protein